MIRHNCVILLCNIPWKWSTDYINQTAIELSKRNTVVCFSWMHARSLREHLLFPGQSIFFKTLHDGVYGYSGLHILPLRRLLWIQQANLWINILIIKLFIRCVIGVKDAQSALLWFFDPRMWPIARSFGHSFSTLYDCVDYWTGDVSTSREARQALARLEKEALEQATTVVVNSHSLYNRHKGTRFDIHVVPQGFRLGTFQKTHSYDLRLSDTKPVVGYVGAINDRLDYGLLVELARRMPQCRFVFVGPTTQADALYANGISTDERRPLFLLPNVSRIAMVDKKYISDIIRQFDICMIPYRTDVAFNQYSFPMKLFEYFYVGKPVLATSIDELKQFHPLVHIATTALEWKQYIRSTLPRRWPAAYRKKQRQRAVANSWSNKINAIYKVLER